MLLAGPSFAQSHGGGVELGDGREGRGESPWLQQFLNRSWAAARVKGSQRLGEAGARLPTLTSSSPAAEAYQILEAKED